SRRRTELTQPITKCTLGAPPAEVDHENAIVHPREKRRAAVGAAARDHERLRRRLELRRHVERAAGEEREEEPEPSHGGELSVRWRLACATSAAAVSADTSCAGMVCTMPCIPRIPRVGARQIRLAQGTIPPLRARNNTAFAYGPSARAPPARRSVRSQAPVTAQRARRVS